MLLNHDRKTPKDWDDAVPSLCPECRAEMIARRGRVLIWHWAHKAKSATGGAGCAAEETRWHLIWKTAYHSFPGWDIEVPVQIAGRTYRADAMNTTTGRLREFVHSLSETYIAKHLALVGAGVDVLWIFDGAEFVAERSRCVARGGIKHLLKPKARWLHDRVGGLVHHDGKLWGHWQGDVWFPKEGAGIDELLRRYAAAKDDLLAAVVP